MLRLTDLWRVEKDETAVSRVPVSQRVWTSGVMKLAFPNHTFSTNVVSSMNGAIRRYLGIDDNVLNNDGTVTVKVEGQSRRCWKTLVLQEATAPADDTAVCFVCLRLLLSLLLSFPFSLSLSLSLSLCLSPSLTLSLSLSLSLSLWREREGNSVCVPVLG